MVEKSGGALHRKGLCSAMTMELGPLRSRKGGLCLQIPQIPTAMSIHHRYLQASGRFLSKAKIRVQQIPFLSLSSNCATVMAAPMTLTRLMAACATAQTITLETIAEFLHLVSLQTIAMVMALQGTWIRLMAVIAAVRTGGVVHSVAFHPPVVLSKIATVMAPPVTKTGLMVACVIAPEAGVVSIVMCLLHALLPPTAVDMVPPSTSTR